MSIPHQLLIEHAGRGARIRQLLRLALVIFLAAVLITEPPAQHRGLCWLLVACYLVWTGAIHLLGTGDRRLRFLWLSLFVDIGVLAGLTLITDSTATVSWTPYLIINGFFLIPVIAATQLSPSICTAVVAPTVIVYLISGLITQHAGQEPTSYVLLRTFMLAAVGVGAVLLSRLQRSRVSTIAGLLSDRTALLDQIMIIEQRERQGLAETLHDGALQYVLGARQELEELAPSSDVIAVERIDHALTESARLLRTTLTQLHPAVLEQAGLVPALRDLVAATGERGRFTITLSCHDWAEGERTGVDELLLSTARELITNVVKHARASAVTVDLAAVDTAQGRVARLRVTDDGQGMAEVDLAGRLADGHLGLVSRRARLEAAGGSMHHHAVVPHGTEVDVVVPVTSIAEQSERA